jgi:hypothetical protein
MPRPCHPVPKLRDVEGGRDGAFLFYHFNDQKVVDTVIVGSGATFPASIG